MRHEHVTDELVKRLFKQMSLKLGLEHVKGFGVPKVKRKTIKSMWSKVGESPYDLVLKIGSVSDRLSEERKL